VIFIALGSNVGDRLAYLRQAIAAMGAFFTIKKSSPVFETEALLPEGSPPAWNRPHCNMVIAGESALSPEALLQRLQEVEHRLGRPPDHLFHAPRTIDLDIVLYHNQKVQTERLTIPHKGLEDRLFLRALLAFLGKTPYPPEESYIPLRSFVLEPKLVGIVNATPDSFSDGGRHLNPDDAVRHMKALEAAGAAVVELGAQSTRPGYTEVSPQVEIERLAPIVERYQGTACLGVDTYFDEVVEYALQHSFLWMNDVKGQLCETTIKKIADCGAQLVTMLCGTDYSWFEERVKTLVHLGMRKENILLDPGVGFGKTRSENLDAIRLCPKLRDYGCPILLGPSRKSCLSSFSPVAAAERDIETLGICASAEADYLRVHAVEDHMRFFVAQQSVLPLLDTEDSRNSHKACPRRACTS
jgi:2-amino-4-hydroxy-6-hydroxymethyldihydropteridine diphosphokinase/dihydropteroate synthase